MAVAFQLTSCALCLLLPASLAGPPSQSLRGQEGDLLHMRGSLPEGEGLRQLQAEVSLPEDLTGSLAEGEGFRQVGAVVVPPEDLTTRCKDNRFRAPDPRPLSSGTAHFPDVWTPSELLFLASDPDWTVGRTWTFSAKVTSAASSDALFAFGGEGSFFRLSFPPGDSFFSVSERVRRVDTLFQFRRSNLDGNVTFTEVCLAPQPALEPVTCLTPEDVCANNAFLAPQPVALSAGARNLADVWFRAELSFLAANPAWTLGSNWTLSAKVSSKASSDARFGFGGGGGFFIVSIPPGDSTFIKTDTVRRVNTVFEFRGSDLDGDVTFSEVCLRQAS